MTKNQLLSVLSCLKPYKRIKVDLHRRNWHKDIRCTEYGNMEYKKCDDIKEEVTTLKHKLHKLGHSSVGSWVKMIMAQVVGRKL